VPNPLVGYQDLGALNALRHPRVLSGAVVTARTTEMLWSNLGTNIQGFKHERTKGEEHEIRLPLIHSP